MPLTSLFKKPAAWVPMVLSLGILMMLLVTLVTVGFVRQADEGTEAHIFQLWLAAEVFLIGFFAVSWLPRAPKAALIVLVVQIIAVLLSCAPVFYFHL